MTELKFLESNEGNSYKFTNKFIQLYDSGNDICSYLIDDIKNVSGLDNINMVYNGILCTLREGYLNKKIMVFPYSIDKFNTVVPLEMQRVDYCNMINLVREGAILQIFKDDYVFKGSNVQQYRKVGNIAFPLFR